MIEHLRQILDLRFGGVLTPGPHDPAGHLACVLELAHVAAGDPWSDTPDQWPDLRPLNDGLWRSDARCTAALLPVLAAYWDWRLWPLARQHAVVTAIILRTVQVVLADLAGLPAPIRQQCRAVTTLHHALDAAEAVGAAAGKLGWVGRMARAAAEAAETAGGDVAVARAAVTAAAVGVGVADAVTSAVRAVNRDQADQLLEQICQLWVDAAAG